MKLHKEEIAYDVAFRSLENGVLQKGVFCILLRRRKVVFYDQILCCLVEFDSKVKLTITTTIVQTLSALI